MDAQGSVIGEVIGQFYSFFGALVRVQDTVANASGMTQADRDSVMGQLAELEREYKNSQEWFITRETQDIRVGVVGTENSLKSALLSVFCDGELDLEGDERDGRTKTKLTVDGKCKLLLIREETGGPSKQLSMWADVIMFVFSYTDKDSLTEINMLYHQLRREREDVPVLLVGIKEDSRPVEVSVSAVKKVVESMDKCEHRDVLLAESNIQNINDLFLKVCRLALTGPTLTALSPPTCPISQSPSHSSLTTFVKGGLPPSSPSQQQQKRRKKQGSRFKQGSFNVQKQMMTESLGSGRHIPVKEGIINKKSSGGLRVEWKKKYLVLSEDEIIYYPSLTDYMQQAHGKSLNLKHITVKVPNKRLPVARSTTAPSNNAGVLQGAGGITIDQTDSLLNDSDHSPSLSPTPPTPVETSLDYFSSTQPGLRMTTADIDNSHEDHVSLSESYGESSSTSSRQQMNLDPVANGRGHNRNSSVDEVLLKMRSVGLSFTTAEGGEERPATLSRLHKGRLDKPRSGFLSVMSPGSDELISESPTGSNESIGSRRKGRNSLIIERSSSGADKEKRPKAGSTSSNSSNSHKRQRSWGGNKGGPESAGANVETADPILESAEFQVLSLDGKVWVFDTGCPEEAALWVKAIEEQIKKMYSENVSHKRMNSSSEMEKKAVLNMEGNSECADCGQPNPEWASINHGCVLCIECSGIHRKMGAHVSRIRSLTLDEWSSDLVGVMLAMGNKKHCQIWEAKGPIVKPTPSSTREEREAFIRAKYIAKEFLCDLLPCNKKAAELLLDAVVSEDIVAIMRILPHSRQDDIDRIHKPPRNCTVLHVACTHGNASIVQLLIWNRANINKPDVYHRPPLYYARQHEHTTIENILVASNCVDDDSSRLSLSSDGGGSTEVLHRTRS